MVLLNKGDGTLGSPTVYGAVRFNPGPATMVAADFNSDGKLDLATAVAFSGKVSVLLNKGNGTFAAAVGYATGSGSQYVTTADFNADGKPDLAVTNYASGTVSVLLNRGDGTFHAATNYPTNVLLTHGLSVGDINGDGRPDLLTITSPDAVIYTTRC